MRKYLLIMLLFGIICTSVLAEEVEQQLKFNLLDAEEYDLSLSISTSIERFYASLEFKVAASELKEADYYAFALSKKVYLERIKVDGMSVPFSYTTDLDPRHFEPELTQTDLLLPEADVYWVSLSNEVIAGKTEDIRINLEYKMILPPWSLDENGREQITWNTEDFFYPRNLNNPADLNITLLTTTFHGVDNADQTMDNGNLRTIKRKIVDIPGQAAKLVFFKS
ncbi:MAG: hypothetical protein PHC57_00570 [Candidatus Cloacimonetes bacterium]|nr:hypothetical protein [Candidatus Cloacimonadota bacterium]